MREEHYRKLERMYVSAPTNQYYRPTMVVGDGSAEILVAVRRDFFHAAGAVHGSVTFKLLDDSAYFAVNSRIEDVLVLTVTFHVTLMRPVSEGQMRARGRVIHRSRRLWVGESVLVDSAGREISRGSGTFMRSRIPLSPDVGYE